MNYIGSKQKLLDFIEKTIESVAGNKEGRIFADLFAGTGAVAGRFREKNYKVIANDIQYYSYVIIRNLVEGDFKSFVKPELVKELNLLKGIDGFIFKNYCPELSERMYFSTENGKRCDAIRNEISFLYNQGKINREQYFNLLSALINSIDKCANTTSVYGAHLKHLKKPAQRDFIFEIDKIPFENIKGKAYNMEAEDLICQIEGDILYLDPPYNARQYSSNYHILETIARNDNPEIKGKTGIRTDNKKSRFCSKKEAPQALEEIIKGAKFKYIFLSYNNEGIIQFETIKNIFEKYGKYQVFKKKYQRYRADKANAREHKADHTFEYLHCLIKN